MTACLYCAESIEDARSFCPHCGESLEGDGLVAFDAVDEPSRGATPDEPADHAGRRGAATGGAADRPGGVTFYAWANCVLGGLASLVAILLVVGAVATLASGDKYAGLVGVFFLASALGAAVFGVPVLAVGLGMLRMKHWSRILALVASWLLIALTVLNALSLLALVVEKLSRGGRFPFVVLGGALGVVFSLAFFGGQIFVLTRPGAKEAFEVA